MTNIAKLALNKEQTDALWRTLAADAPMGESISHAFARNVVTAHVRAWQQQNLDFEPDANHTVADMANVGRSLMREIAAFCPDYRWTVSPAEIVSVLINKHNDLERGMRAVIADILGRAIILPAPGEGQSGFAPPTERGSDHG